MPTPPYPSGSSGPSPKATHRVAITALLTAIGARPDELPDVVELLIGLDIPSDYAAVHEQAARALAGHRAARSDHDGARAALSPYAGHYAAAARADALGTVGPIEPSPADAVLMPWPRVAPLGIALSASAVQDVWDAYVKPAQDSPQSMEMRSLMAILRSVSAAMTRVDFQTGKRVKVVPESYDLEVYSDDIDTWLLCTRCGEKFVQIEGSDQWSVLVDMAAEHELEKCPVKAAGS